MAGLMLSLFVAAMDSTVVGTALPTIARELGEFQLYPWVFSGYLITATTTVPIWPTRRSLRPPPGAADRHHDLRDGLHAVCRQPRHGRAHRVSNSAGRRGGLYPA